MPVNPEQHINPGGGGYPQGPPAPVTLKDIQQDKAAFEQLFREHFKPLYVYCQYKFGFDTDQAKEVVHLAFIKLWKTRETLSPELPAKACLYKIILHNSLDILKHEKVKKKFGEYILQQHALNPSASDLENFDLKKLRADIHSAIAELPDQMRRIFELSRQEGLKYAEIARLLNISVNTVETQMVRALKKLRKKLADYGPLGLIPLIINSII